MRVALVGAEPTGGAGRALQRIYEAIIKASQNDSGFEVDLIWAFRSRAEKGVPEWRGNSARFPFGFKIQLLVHRVFNALRALAGKSRVSVPIHGTGIARYLHSQRYDLVLLGWLGEKTMSFGEIEALEAPLAMRHADMWGLTTGSHYKDVTKIRDDYQKNHHFSFTKNVLLRKAEALENARFFVFPSNWLAHEFADLGLYPLVENATIQNPIDVEFWSKQPAARKRLGLSESAKILLFVVPGNLGDPRKGGDLLEEIIAKLDKRLAHTESKSDILVCLVGKGRVPITGTRLSVSRIRSADDSTLRDLYSAADLLIAPARVDNSPNVVIEALACSLPVVAFSTSGLPEIVKNGLNGKLVEAFDVDSMVEQTWNLLHEEETRAQMASNAREIAAEHWSYQVIGEQYVQLLKSWAQPKQ